MCTCNNKCRPGMCWWCDASIDEQREYIDQEYHNKMTERENQLLKITDDRLKQMQAKQDAELERHYRYFLSIGETPEQARKSANVEYLMCL